MIYFALTVTIIALISWGVIQKRAKEDRLTFNKMVAISELANAIQCHCIHYQLNDGDPLCTWSDVCVTWCSFYSSKYAYIQETLLSTKLIDSKSVSIKHIKKWYFLMMCQLYVFLKYQIQQDLSDNSIRSEEFKKDLSNIWNTWEEKTYPLMTE